jgi:predicted naringenin-chalcone synthase
MATGGELTFAGIRAPSASATQLLLLSWPATGFKLLFIGLSIGIAAGGRAERYVRPFPAKRVAVRIDALAPG